MAKFQSNPKVIEAEQWFPGKEVAGVTKIPAHISPSRIPGEGFPVPDSYYVTTIHGQKAYLEAGDWVITEPDGAHYYPCKPDIFEKSYKPA